MTDERVFAPGSWSVAKARRNLVGSSGALGFIVVPVLLIGLRGIGILPGLLIGVAVVAVTVPLALLWVRFGVMPMRVILTEDAVELRRGTRIRRRLSRQRRLRALTFQSEGAGQRIGPQQLLLSDGRRAIRLSDGRWLDQHQPILDALGLRAGPVPQRIAMRQHPYAFHWVERHAAISAFLIILGLLALVVLIGWAAAALVG